MGVRWRHVIRNHVISCHVMSCDMTGERAEREAKDAERLKDEKPRQVHITEDGRVLPVLENTYDEEDPHRGEEQLGNASHQMRNTLFVYACLIHTC